jgi:hypothetical protein
MYGWALVCDRADGGKASRVAFRGARDRGAAEDDSTRPLFPPS